MNERITENLLRKLLEKRGWEDDKNVVVNPQKCTNKKIDNLLKNASKKGSGRGIPDFIIWFHNNLKKVIVVECKADFLDLQKAEQEVKHYAEKLKEEYDVLAIAFAGKKNPRVTYFNWEKGNNKCEEVEYEIFPTPKEIYDEKIKFILENEEFYTKLAAQYNKRLHKDGLPVAARCTLISAILVALHNDTFIKGYEDYNSGEALVEFIINCCKSYLKNNLEESKKKIVIAEYSKFENIDKFKNETGVLKKLITNVYEDLYGAIKNHKFDVLGKFYTEFLRYFGSDQSIGIVLTPAHITDFFCEVANLTEDSVVFDPCCGTGGFLVSAMNHMLTKAGNNEEQKKNIKAKQLLGIELAPDMFTHACSNMLMRGDGKSQIYAGDCFNRETLSKIKGKKPTVAFLNPPYTKGNTAEQLKFIDNALDCLEPKGLTVAICQTSTTISLHKSVIAQKAELMQKHTLEAVFSMPNELFYPVGVVTSILVFRAKVQHSNTKETFFGYFKDDGFVKTKDKGRIDKEEKWGEIKKKWLDAYLNHKNIPDLSVNRKVNPEDEWCAEAYLETDYSKITKEKFIVEIKDYIAFNVRFGDEIS